MNVQNRRTGYKLSNCLSGEFNAWKQLRLHFKVKSKANIPIAKFRKNDLINIFMMKTIKEYNIIGEEQYNMRHRVWIIGLNLMDFYILEPRRRELSVIINGPIQRPINILVNASSEPPFVLKAANPEVTREITKGPHRSHYLCNFL